MKPPKRARQGRLKVFGFGSVVSNDLAIDLGTANSLVYSSGKGIVVNEPSIVAVNSVTGQVEAVGLAAQEMLGRTPQNITAVRPLRNGVIADFKVTEKMLVYLIQKAHGRKRFLHPRVIVSVPSEVTPVEKRAVTDSAARAQASEVFLVDQAMMAAIGAGLAIHEPAGNMVVDIGGGTTDIAVISLSGVVYSKSIRVAGDQMDEAIANFMKQRHSLLIGERTAQIIKHQIGSASPLEEPLKMEVRGRNLLQGVPQAITIRDTEIREALADCVNVIVGSVLAALERVPPELAGDLVDRGITLVGGGASLRQLDRRLSAETKLPVYLAENYSSAVVMGTGKLLSDFKLLRRVSLEVYD